MSNSENQLKQLTFINAASLPYAHVDIDGNTLFSGRNGAGKTTILRAVLYFYGAYRSESLGISRKKKRFEEFYFTRANSYLVYRYSNDFGNAMVIVYRSSGVKVRYRFVKEPADTPFTEELLQEIFLKDGVAKDPKELFNSFLGKNFELSPVISSSKEYKSILYGQDRRLISYSFYQANGEYEQIAKTISNIFVNSKLDSGSIKKSLASSIAGFAPIDLNQMEQMLEGFKESHEDIKNFQKHESTIVEAIGSLAELEEHNEKIATSLGQLKANKLLKEDLVVKENENLTTKQEASQKLQETFNASRMLYDTNKENYLKESAVLQAQLTEIKQKEAYYEHENISEKVKLFATLDSKLEKVQSIQKQKSFLTQTFTSVTDQFEALKKEEKEQFLRKNQENIVRINEIERTFNENLSSLMQEQHQGLEQFNVNETKNLESLQSVFLNDKELYQKTQFSYDNLAHKNFLQDELGVAAEAQRFSVESLNKLHNNIEMVKKDLELVYAQVSQKEQYLAQYLDGNRDKYMHEKERIDVEIQSIQTKLEHFEHSLFGFIKNNEVAHANKLFKVIKEDVLFSSGLSPKVVESSSLLGLDIDYDVLPDVDFNMEVLEQTLQSLRDKLAQRTKLYEEKKVQLENETRNEVNALKRQEQNLRQELDTFAQQLPKLERATLESKEAVLRLQKQAQETKEEALSQIKIELEKAQNSYQLSHAAFTQAQEQMREGKESLRIKFEAKKTSLLEQIDVSKNSIREEQSSLQAHYDTQVANLQSQEDAALKDGGVDTSLLETYDKELELLAREISEIKVYADIVKEYEIDSKRLFRGLADKQQELEDLKVNYNNESHVFNASKYEFDESYKITQSEVNSIDRNIKKLRSELSSFDTFMLSSFGEVLMDTSTSEVQANDESLKELIEIIKEASFSKEKASSNLSKKLRRVFDKLSVNSSFNIQRPESEDELEMIKAARALESFVLDNKIDTFKAEVSRLYASVLHLIACETTELLKADSEIKKTVAHINQTLSDLQGIKVVENVELKFRASDNPILNLLTVISELQASMPYGNENLFSQESDKKYHKEVLNALADLSHALDKDKNDQLSIEDSFVLEFRAIENGHDTGFVSSLDGIGSNGTDVMVKAMVYIAMLSLAREQSSKEDSKVIFHCILDEVGILAPNYLKELINYANAKNIRFLNGAPDEKLVTTYKRLYMLSTNDKHQTKVRRLLAQV